MAVQMLSQYSCTPLLLVFLTEVNCLSLNLFLTTSSHFSWGYRALWAHTYIFSVSDWRKKTSKSLQIGSHSEIKCRPHPLKLCNTNWDGNYAECFLWHSQVLQLPHLAPLCSFWIVPWPSAFPLTNLPQQLSHPVLLQCKYSAFPFLHPAPKTDLLTTSGIALCLPWVPYIDALSHSPKEQSIVPLFRVSPFYSQYPTEDRCLLVCTKTGILISTWVFELIKFLQWNFSPCFP